MTSHAKGRTSDPEILARYQCSEGIRQLVSQQVAGRVALSDIPAGAHGKVYLIERHIPSSSELDGIVGDYLALAAELGRPPMAESWFV
jgi:hypothetical protein